VLDRRVALKLLHGEPGEWARSFLLREAQAMAKLTHPNVVTVYELGEHEGGFFLAMQLVEGASLAEWLAEAPRRPEEIVARFVEAGRGLEAAHSAGVVHRDFKPENVLVGRDGRARVTDFGISRLPAGPETAGRPQGTLTGKRAGTPAYMAPEQLAGGAVDARADLYSFCLALTESLTGKPLFDAAETEARLAAMRSPRLPDTLPAAARAAVARGLAFDRDDRPAITPLLEALSVGPARRRWPLWAALALGLGGAGLLAWRASRPTNAAAPAAELPWVEMAPLELRVGDRLPFTLPDLKRVAVGAPEVLDIRPTAPAAFVLTAVAPGETYLMAWTPAERRRGKVTVRPAR
jgi:serine/threonine-protein kinase